MKYIIVLVLLIFTIQVNSQVHWGSLRGRSYLIDSIERQSADSLWKAKYKVRYDVYTIKYNEAFDSFAFYMDKVSSCILYNGNLNKRKQYGALEIKYHEEMRMWGKKQEELTNAWGRELCGCN